MTLSFSDLFNKAKARLKSAAVAEVPEPPRPAPVEKTSGERLSKTVLPHTVRTLERPESSGSAAASAGTGRQSHSVPVVRPAVASSASGMRSRQQSRSGVLGLESQTERSISLRLADIVQNVPPGHLKPQEALDLSQIVQINAAEIEKGMGQNNPTIPLTALYEQVPEIFLDRLSPTESACISLSYEKVLGEFKSLRVRSDQIGDDLVPQVETPFLKLTMEDTERFGITMEPVKSSALPPVRVEMASAETIAAATPEPVASQKIRPRSSPSLRPSVSLSEPTEAEREVPRPNSSAVPAESKKISLHLPPKGTGVPASERVPASSGPPVPTNLPEQSPKTAAIPFTKVTAPSDDLREKFQRSPAPPAPRKTGAPSAASTADNEVKIPLVLSRILEGVPPFQLNGSPSSIGENVQIELPLSLIQPQLASGRVVVSPTVLQRAMPEACRNLLNIDPGESPISLPLEEILKKLPTAALQLRADQEETVLTEKFETMFSIKADEDAKRLRTATKPGVEASQAPTDQHPPQESTAKKKEEQAQSKSATIPVAPTAETKEAETETAVAEPNTPPVLSKSDEKVQSPQPVKEIPQASLKTTIAPKILETVQPQREETPAKGPESIEKLDAKSVIARAGVLPGVAACAITFADDGLVVAGGLPPELAADGISAMAPSLLQKVANHICDTQLGSFTSMTLHCEKSALTFFMHGNICLAALHGGGDLSPETRAALGTMTWALARTYSKPEPAHVDH